MAIFLMQVSTIGRFHGRTATAAAAYRSCCKIVDERTGEVFDYTKKGGLDSSDLVLPAAVPTWATNRAELWNRAEVAEKRSDATVAREFLVALPAELSAEQRHKLALAFARELCDAHGFAADVSIHQPGAEGDQRNHHAHILCTTRRLTADGFGKKTRELDNRYSGEVVRWRKRWEELANEALREAGVEARIDHRSLEEQGIDRVPTQHLGPAATAIERMTGEPSELRLRLAAEAEDRKRKRDELRKAQAELEAAEHAERSLASQIAIHEKLVEIEMAKAAPAPAPVLPVDLLPPRVDELRSPGAPAYRPKLKALRVPKGWRADWTDETRSAIAFERVDGRRSFIDQGDHLAATSTFARADCGVMFVAALAKWGSPASIQIDGSTEFRRTMAFTAARLGHLDRLADRQLAAQGRADFDQFLATPQGQEWKAKQDAQRAAAAAAQASPQPGADAPRMSAKDAARWDAIAARAQELQAERDAQREAERGMTDEERRQRRKDLER